MSDNLAVMQGYTKHVLIEGGNSSFAALVKPETDFDTVFKCFDTDNQEWLQVLGYNCDIETLEDEEEG